jgi:hypothetical protein
VKQPSKKNSSEKENIKVNTGKQNTDNEVREDENNSICKENNNKKDYPYQQVQEKKFKNQPEFIDKNSGSKDKS